MVDESEGHLTLDGDYDLMRKAELTALLVPMLKFKTVVINLQDVGYLDSTALSCFVSLQRQMTEAGPGGKIRLANPQRQIGRLFHITGLDRIFDVDGTPGENGAIGAA